MAIDQETKFVESTKLLFDLLKHSTTVSTGSILIMVTFLEKLFAEPTFKWLVAVSLVCLVISVVGSLVSMFFLSVNLKEQFKPNSAEYNVSVLSFVVCLAGFSFGILTFVIFSLINFFR